MPFCGKESVCPRCDGVIGCETTAANQSMRMTADSEPRGPLEDLAEVRRIIESSDKGEEENRKLINHVINKCPHVGIKDWVKDISKVLVTLALADIAKLLKEEIRKKKKKKEIDRTDIDIIFVAHGGIDSSMIPADCLMPLPSIRDVVLYSPWNCAINADAVYGIATGSIQPHHRRFFCIPPRPEEPERCPRPDIDHQPTNLPNRWNSMREAGESSIPNILVSPLKEPQDNAWNGVLYLQNILGEPGRNRVLIPFTCPRKMDPTDKIPFWIVTLVLSVVLDLYNCRATVHLAACLNRSETLNEAELKRQYEYTIDNTGMTSSEERIRNVHWGLYKFFKDMFG